MTKTERQLLAIKRWVKAGGRNCIVASTGFGKTRLALMVIQQLVNKHPDCFIYIVVPTQVLKDQWMQQLIDWGLFNNCKVEVVNTAIKSITDCDLVVYDEIHLFVADTFAQVFEKVSYKLFLGLTATMERLDGKEKIINQYAPVCDTITIDECLVNSWVSPVKEYVVLLDVDLTEYNEWNRKFIGLFAYFNYDFKLAMDVSTSVVKRNAWAKAMHITSKEASGIAMGWLTSLKKRKAFIQSHPKKLEICKKIIDARKDKKIITFSSTIKEAEKIGVGYVLHSKQSKAYNKKILDQFNADKVGVINSNKALNTGVDVTGLSVGIIMNTDSSKIKRTQTVGRCIRFEPGKVAEIFTLIINHTQELTWLNNSISQDYITITEEELEQVLQGKIVVGTKHKKIENKKYRF